MAPKTISPVDLPPGGLKLTRAIDYQQIGLSREFDNEAIALYRGVGHTFLYSSLVKPGTSLTGTIDQVLF